METFTQPKITGYRQLSEAEVALMNEGKALAEQCGAFITKLRAIDAPRSPTAEQVRAFADAQDVSLAEAKATLSKPPAPTLDQRWISIGATDLQRGFMAVIRGIAQPTTF